MWTGSDFCKFDLYWLMGNLEIMALLTFKSFGLLFHSYVIFGQLLLG